MDGPNLAADQPLVTLARRHTGVKNGGGTVRDVVFLPGAVEAGDPELPGDYWKGPFCRLEAEGFDGVLADAKQARNLPGRPKRDPSDSRWLAACFELA